MTWAMLVPRKGTEFHWIAKTFIDKTPLHRLHGRKDNTPNLDFRREDLVPKPAREGKWEPRFHPGVFVGMLSSSSEAVVVTEHGLAIKVRLTPVLAGAFRDEKPPISSVSHASTC